MPVLQPQIYVNGVALNSRLSNEILWKQTEGLFDGSALEPGVTLPTFDGPAKVRAHDMAYQPRRLVITGRIINRAGWLDKQKAIASLAEVFAGRPAIVRLGTLYLEAEFGPVTPVDDAYSHLPGYQTWRVEGEAIPGTFFGQYHTALGADQGLAVQDDRPDSAAVKFTSNSFTYTCPGTAPTEACVSLTGAASTVYYLKGKGLRRVPMTTDAAGNASIDEMIGFIVYPGANPIRVEDSAGALAAGVTGVNLYGTRPRYLGNAPTAATTQSATTNRMSEGPMLTVARTGPKSCLSLAGTLSTATDGQPAIGLPGVARRNLFASSLNPLDSYWSKGEAAPFSMNAAANPVSGTVDAVKWTAQAGAVGHFFKRALFALVSGTTYTLSIYVKKGSYRYFGLVPGTTAGGYTTFDLDTGTWTNYSTGVTAGDVSATPLADGWWRLSVRYAATGTADVNFAMTNSTGSTSGWTAVGTEHVYFWNPQIEVGTSPSAPQPTNATGVDLTNPLNGAGLALEVGTTNRFSSNVATGTDTSAATTGFRSGASTHLNAGATITSDATQFYQGARSLKVVTPGALSSEGVENDNTAVSGLAANTAYTGSLRIKGTAGVVLNVRLRDYTNSVNGAAAPITLTGGWDYVSASVTSGAIAPTDIRLSVSTNGTLATTFYLDTLQLEALPFPTSWVDGTRNADLCGIVAPHNLLKYSEATDNALWSRTSITSVATGQTAPNNTATAIKFTPGAFVNAGIGQTALSSGVAGKTYTFSIWLKADAAHNAKLQIWDGVANQGVITVPVTTAWQRFACPAALGANATMALPAVYFDSSGGGAVTYAWGAQLVEGSHPGIYARTTDTPIPAPTSPALDPAWSQNGMVRVRILPPSTYTNASHVLFGAYYDLCLYVTSNLLRLERKQNTNTGTFGTGAPGRSALSISPAVIYDGAPHEVWLVWKNYVVAGVRYMPMELWVDGVLIASQDVAALYGATAWATIDPSRLISDGNVFATLSAPTSGRMIDWPQLPAGAIPAT